MRPSGWWIPLQTVSGNGTFWSKLAGLWWLPAGWLEGPALQRNGSQGECLPYSRDRGLLHTRDEKFREELGLYLCRCICTACLPVAFGSISSSICFWSAFHRRRSILSAFLCASLSSSRAASIPSLTACPSPPACYQALQSCRVFSLRWCHYFGQSVFFKCKIDITTFNMSILAVCDVRD